MFLIDPILIDHVRHSLAKKRFCAGEIATMVVMVVTCTIIDILMIRKKKETRTVITNALTFFSIMKGHWVLLQAQVIVFYMKVFPISRAIFPLRPHFITGEYRVIIIIISIIIIIVTIVAVAIAPNILFYIDRSIVTVTVVFMVKKFVKPSQTNLS